MARLETGPEASSSVGLPWLRSMRWSNSAIVDCVCLGLIWTTR